ncbi:MAG: imidazoleglycerol-phosphate dehydratase HisB [Deltaproteobacteria bacterium]|nr:imidazoleglycerol-phosphate dehydratase HisB [Deltaproteobacteria bacterium]
MKRTAKVDRKTKETSISLEIDLDGKGDSRIKTPIPFFNHMLELFAKHGLFNLKLTALGDVDVDDHHLVEDVGISLGEAIKTALGNKKGIRRYGFFTLPMDETLTTVAVDFPGRPSLVYQSPIKKGKIKTFDLELVEHFFESFVYAAGANLHIQVQHGRIKHHIVESIFKAFARAVDMATQIDPRVKGVPSTKGVL